MPKFPQNIVITATSRKILFYLFLGAGIFFLGIRYNLNFFDEGVGLVGAERVLRGELPYLNFWTIYGPGGYYLFAAWMGIWGATVMSARILTAILMIFSAFVIFLLVKKHSNIRYGLMAYFASILWLSTVPFNARAIAPAILCMLITISFADEYFSSRRKDPIFIGFLCGLTTVFRHDYGMILVIGFVIVCFFLSKQKLNEDKETFFSRPIKIIIRFAVGLSIVIVPTAAFFLSQIPARILIDQLISVNFGNFTSQFKLSLPIPFYPQEMASGAILWKEILREGWEGLMAYFPFIIYVLTLLRSFKKSDFSRERRFPMASYLAIFAGIFLYSQFLRRADVEHILPTLLLSLIPFSFWSHTVHEQWKRTCSLLVVLAIISMPLFWKIKSIVAVSSPSAYSLTIAKGKGIIVGQEWGHDMEQAVRYIQAQVPVGERIFVGCSRHDRININDAAFYFLADRLPGTFYNDLPRGLATSEPIQRHGRSTNQIKAAEQRAAGSWMSTSESIIGALPNSVCIGSFRSSDFFQSVAHHS
jgi:hypothetical protein